MAKAKTRAVKKAKPSPKRTRGVVRNELHCHECDRYVQFDIDLDLEGNHVLACPNCGHEHCRVVKDGVITGERWDSRNGQTIYVSAATTSSTYISVDSTAFASTGDVYLSDLWIQTAYSC